MLQVKISRKDSFGDVTATFDDFEEATTLMFILCRAVDSEGLLFEFSTVDEVTDK